MAASVFSQAPVQLAVVEPDGRVAFRVEAVCTALAGAPG
jgi:hypothetical protein